MKIVKAGTLYFAVVFGAGFVLGTLRVLWLVPQLGDRNSELMESPFMITISYCAARWIVRRFTPTPTAVGLLGVGTFALALMLAFEFGVVLPLRGLTITQYSAARDPVSGAVYYFSLALFALFPFLIHRRPCRPK
jgi:hypothetical protein